MGQSSQVTALHATDAANHEPAAHCEQSLFSTATNCPATHVAKASERTVENSPHAHGAHCAGLCAPESLENVLMGHSWHCPADVAACSGWKVLFSQNSHAAEQGALLKPPSRHAAQAPPPDTCEAVSVMALASIEGCAVQK